jgi:hypothetical protein
MSMTKVREGNKKENSLFHKGNKYIQLDTESPMSSLKHILNDQVGKWKEVRMIILILRIHNHIK